MPEDGISRRDYVLRVNRPLSSEARLSSLSTSLPGFPAAFDPEVQVYPVTVSGGTSSITVTATPMAAQASFTVQGVAGVAGVPSGEIPSMRG
ncbi:MAG: cadherin-like beta sandwich domain-containing protein [Xanthomonadales bacterium]|nr:cadherin-like beta sandwich domain-containing protein [Xanthomonadales bacterium]